jgi:predicted transcriptional regulator of viral defense system
MGRDPPDTLRVIVRQQSGVLSRQQVLRAGLSAETVRSKVKTGQWRRIYRGVYAVQPGHLSRRGELWAAVLAAGEGAVLSHETAAELHGIINKPSRIIHVTVPVKRTVTPIRGLKVHRSDRVLGRRFPIGELPLTWREETVLDLTDEAQDFDTVCGWVTAAFAKRTVTDGTMRAFMSRRMKLRWRGDLDHLVTEAASGTHSPLEYRYDRDVERAHALPTSKHQAKYTKPDGTKGYRDRYYEDYGVVVELDGKAAHPDEYRWRDTERDNDAAARFNSQSLRYGFRHVRGQPCLTAIQVGQVLRNRGWSGAPHPCSPGCQVP